MRFFVFVFFWQWCKNFFVFLGLYPRPPRLQSTHLSTYSTYPCIHLSLHPHTSSYPSLDLVDWSISIFDWSISIFDLVDWSSRLIYLYIFTYTHMCIHYIFTTYSNTLACLLYIHYIFTHAHPKYSNRHIAHHAHTTRTPHTTTT